MYDPVPLVLPRVPCHNPSLSSNEPCMSFSLHLLCMGMPPRAALGVLTCGQPSSHTCIEFDLMR